MLAFLHCLFKPEIKKLSPCCTEEPLLQGTMAHDAFIHYAKPDRLAAESVCMALEQAGVQCWMASRDVPPGAEWGKAIIEAITESRMMVLLFSAAAHSRRMCVARSRKEVGYFLGRFDG